MSSYYDTPQTDTKNQKLLECILTRNSKLYLGKVYTEEQINKLSDEEVDKLFSNYEAKLSGQVVKSLGKSIINMYSMGACTTLQQATSNKQVYHNNCTTSNKQLYHFTTKSKQSGCIE